MLHYWPFHVTCLKTSWFYSTPTWSYIFYSTIFSWECGLRDRPGVLPSSEAELKRGQGCCLGKWRSHEGEFDEKQEELGCGLLFKRCGWCLHLRDIRVSTGWMLNAGPGWGTDWEGPGLPPPAGVSDNRPLRQTQSGKEPFSTAGKRNMAHCFWDHHFDIQSGLTHTFLLECPLLH